MRNIKKAMISCFIVALFVAGSCATIGVGTQATELTEKVTTTFVEPTITEKDTFVELNLQGTNSWVFIGGNPMLPLRTETVTLPFGATITNIACEAHGIQTMTLSKKVMPAPRPVPLTDEIQVSSEPLMNKEIYDATQLYPDNWFSYDLGAGLDKNNNHKTFLGITTYPIRYNPGLDTISYAESIDVTYSYTVPDSTPFPATTEYKLVIIAPAKFSSSLQKLVDFKNSKGMITILKTTADIYKTYNGYDKPEKIKYFIKDAMETWNTSYVLLAGGLKSYIYGNPRENRNEGTRSWNVPVRYTNQGGAGDDPGFISDLYYADVYASNGSFCSWDGNGNHIYAEGSGDKIDRYPDVAVGRLPCRTTKEMNDVVDKIITYESGPSDPSWFNKIVGISGDGFLDQAAINMNWDTQGLANGEYTIYARSTNDENVTGPADIIHITIDKTKATNMTFNHDDNLITGLKYPFPPVAEIVSVSEGNILGNTPFSYVPTEGQAYCNGFTHWADMKYQGGVLRIGGKTYDPRPYGVNTSIHVWINNSGGTTVFDETKTGFQMYYEGEWTTGELLLHNRSGGPYYMPPAFNRTYLWTSNGKFDNQTDVIDALSQGAGFVFFSGHGSPNVWADHYPGIPGNRRLGGLTGLMVSNYGYPKNKIPLFPMGTLTNDYKNPIVVVGGCHNSMFNVSAITTLLDKGPLWSYHVPTPECWSERLVNIGKRGAIATLGNTALGLGVLGEWCTVGGYDNYITTEFFVQYGTNGYHVLGQTYAQTVTGYIDNFKGGWDKEHLKTVEEWVLLGDPSLMIGGYS